MGGSYHEKMNITESINNDSRLNRSANKISLLLGLILVVLSIISVGVYMSAFELLIDERHESGSNDHRHHHSKSEKIVTLNTTFNETNGGHTFMVKSLASLGNDLLASSGYDSKIKIWNIKRMTLNHTFDVSINNNTNYMEGLVAIGKNMLSSASWDYYVRYKKISN
jgi:WD40 repeat protein